MKTIPSPNAALYTDTLTKESVTALTTSGFTTVIVGLFHVHPDGQFYYNDSPADDSVIALIQQLKGQGSNVKCVLMSIGGGNWPGHPRSVSDDDYPNLKASWLTPAQGKTLTSKQWLINFMQKANIDGLDLDYEPVKTTFDVNFIAHVANDIKEAGFLVTAAPYTDDSSWMSVIKETFQNGANSFAWWNLQQYGGADYNDWVTELSVISSKTGISVSAIQSFLLPGYKVSCPNTPANDPNSPTLVHLKKKYPGINGAFIWRYKHIAGCLSTEAKAIINAVN